MTRLMVRSLSDQLVDVVRDRILNGTVPTGHPIRQDTLASELGVSKIPLREALARLAQEGLVRSQANYGYYVTSLNTAEAEEVFALRLKLEPEVVAIASMCADEAERNVALETHERLAQATKLHSSGAGSHNRAFHLALIRPSRRPITTHMLERLHVLGERYVRKHLEPLGRDERARIEHEQLLKSWLARDRQGVMKAVRAHINKTLVDLRRQLSTAPED